MYFRELKATRAAALFGALAVGLCAYNFSLVRNCTLPASMAWFPLMLYFEKKICKESGYRLRYIFGLALSFAMMMHVGRPEVGAPELFIVVLAICSRPAMYLLGRGGGRSDGGNSDEAARPDREGGTDAAAAGGGPDRAGGTDRAGGPDAAAAGGEPDRAGGTERAIGPDWKGWFLKMAALALGLLLAMPTVAPGIEWTALSPRSQGMALKWVLTWSANWYDFLSLIFGQPLGNLCVLDNQTAQFRGMVLSRTGYIPFLSTAYISPLCFTLAFWGLFDRKNRKKLICILLFVGLSVLALGRHTPVAPAVLSLSPFLSAFRYPVKLMFFPGLVLIFFAVKGMDLLLKNLISKKVLLATAIFWTLILLFGSALLLIPEIGYEASKWRWLFTVQPQIPALERAQTLMAASLISGASAGLLSCLFAFMLAKEKITKHSCGIFFAVALALLLFQCSLGTRQVCASGFYEKPGFIASEIRETKEKEYAQNPVAITNDAGYLNTRYLNLYFDPLTIPPSYSIKTEAGFDEDFFQYSRQMLLYQTGIDFDIPSSYGYEAAETADYKNTFYNAFKVSSQFINGHEPKVKGTMEKRPKTVPEKRSDGPIHRFAELTATEFVNTQAYHRKPANKMPRLNKDLFELIDENEELNYRTYRVKNTRARFYFTDRLVFVESFKDLQTLLSTTEDLPQAEIIDDSTDISYFLNRDFEKHKRGFKVIDALKFDSEKSTPDDPTLKSSMDIVFDNGQEIVLDLALNRPAVLVIADHYYPGWVAELDGVGVPVIKANLLNKAVLIPEGKHRLRLTYKPWSLVLGFAFAGLGALGLLLLGLARKRGWF